MANVYAHTHWILDTAGVVTTDKVRIQKMEWVPTVASDDLTILDNNDETIWDIDADTTPSREKIDFDSGHDFLGFNLSVIDSGVLYVYLK